jgi:chemotaxis protein CheY-P-specific phosphatase CheC
LLVEVRDEYEGAAQPDTRKLEESLTGLDRMLDDAIRKSIPDVHLTAITTEVESQLKPYKRHMDKTAYEQTRTNLLRKRLREYFDVPRLSLFYL